MPVASSDGWQHTANDLLSLLLIVEEYA